MHGEQEDTRCEDHPPWEAVANEPGLNPSQPHISIPSLVARAARSTPPAPPRRMPKATPPAPIAAAQTAMPAPMAPTPMHVAAGPMPMQMPVTPGRFYSYAETCAQQVDSTAPVAPLPFAELITASVPRQVPRWSRIAMPIGGVVAVVVFAVAFFASRDHRPELPSIASVSRAEPAVVAAAAPEPAAIPADSHWKPRAVVPTIAAEIPHAETAPAAPAASLDAAIDAATQPRAAAPVAVAKPVAAKPRRASPKRVAIATTHASPKRAAPTKPSHRVESSSAKSRRVKVDTSSPLGSLRPKKAW